MNFILQSIQFELYLIFVTMQTSLMNFINPFDFVVIVDTIQPIWSIIIIEAIKLYTEFYDLLPIIFVMAFIGLNFGLFIIALFVNPNFKSNKSNKSNCNFNSNSILDSQQDEASTQTQAPSTDSSLSEVLTLETFSNSESTLQDHTESQDGGSLLEETIVQTPDVGSDEQLWNSFKLDREQFSGHFNHDGSSETLGDDQESGDLSSNFSNVGSNGLDDDEERESLADEDQDGFSEWSESSHQEGNYDQEGGRDDYNPFAAVVGYFCCWGRVVEMICSQEFAAMHGQVSQPFELAHRLLLQDQDDQLCEASSPVVVASYDAQALPSPISSEVEQDLEAEVDTPSTPLLHQSSLLFGSNLELQSPQPSEAATLVENESQSHFNDQDATTTSSTQGKESTPIFTTFDVDFQEKLKAKVESLVETEIEAKIPLITQKVALELASSAQKLTLVEKEKDEWKEKAEAAEIQLSQVKSQNEENLRKLEESEARIKELEEKLRVQTSEIGEARAQQARSELQFTVRSTEIQSLRAAVESQEKELVVKEEAIGIKDGKIQELTAQLTSTQAQLSTCQSDLEVQQRTIDSNLEQKHKLRKEVSFWMAGTWELEGISRQIGKLERKSDDAVLAAKECGRKRKQDWAGFKRALKRSGAEVSKVKKEKVLVEESMSTLETEIEKLNSINESLSTRNHQLNAFLTVDLDEMASWNWDGMASLGGNHIVTKRGEDYGIYDVKLS